MVDELSQHQTFSGCGSINVNVTHGSCARPASRSLPVRTPEACGSRFMRVRVDSVRGSFRRRAERPREIGYRLGCVVGSRSAAARLRRLKSGCRRSSCTALTGDTNAAASHTILETSTIAGHCSDSTTGAHSRFFLTFPCLDASSAARHEATLRSVCKIRCASELAC